MPSLLLPALLFVVTAPGPARTVWLLEQPEWKRERAALLESLLMYTRDLREPVSINLSPAIAEDPEAQPAQDEQAQAADRHCEAGGLLVLSFGGSREAPALSIHDCRDDGETIVPLIPADDLDVAAQALALRLRGILARQPEPPPSPPPVASPVPRAPKVQAQARALPPSTAHAWELGVAGALVAASTGSGLRPGVTIKVARFWASPSLALEMDTTLATAVTYDAFGYHASVRDWPLGLALSFRTQIGPWLLAGGPRASLHLVEASGRFKDGRAGKSSELSAGLGAMGYVHYRIWKPLAVGVALSGELLLPRQRYSLDRDHTVDIGMSHLVLAAGVVYSF